MRMIFLFGFLNVFIIVANCHVVSKKEYFTENSQQYSDAQNNENDLDNLEINIEESITQERKLISEFFDNIKEWTCEDIKKYFVKFCNEQKQLKECQQDDDCVIVGLRGDCDCAQGPTGIAEPIAVSKESEDVRLLEQRFFSAECYYVRQCSYHYSKGPSVFQPSCEGGMCRVKLKEGFTTFICGG